MDKERLENRFDDLVFELFRAEGFHAECKPIIPAGRGFDWSPHLLVRSRTGATAIGGTHIYRSRTMPAYALRSSALQAEYMRRAWPADRGILVIGNKVESRGRNEVKSLFPDLLVYDIDNVAFLVAKHPALRSTFDDITREALPFSEVAAPQPLEANIELDISRPPTAPAAPAIAKETKGSDLCNEICAIPMGRADARRFEEKVIEALRYIFDKDLTAWSPQKASDTQLSFYDLVARVASEHDFWNAIVSQFRSRYIVFEFKNYGTKIKQTQIYTTEKYLFGTALRSMAIIISRNGADKNALAAARGALRDSGKLMVNLDIQDLCDMLHRKEKGDDHNSILVERVDDMLMKLER
jgi:hypothetical protein